MMPPLSDLDLFPGKDLDRTESAAPDREKEEEKSQESEKKGPSLGRLDAAAGDDDDGFRTPTEPEYRIPEPTECPPAPKRALYRQSPVKRRILAPSPSFQRLVQEYLEQWRETGRSPPPSLPSSVTDDGGDGGGGDNGGHREAKRARTEKGWK